MRIPRIFHLGALLIGNDVLLNEMASNHLLRVLRMKVGFELVVFNGEAYEGKLGEFKATIVATEKNQARVKIESFVEKNNESPLAIHLGQAISRGDRMDYTLQKSVELGVKEITPLFTERCGVDLQGERLVKKIQHWQNIVINACEQSGRCIVPKVNPAIGLDEWLATLTADIKLIADPRSHIRLNNIDKEIKTVALLCGSEGGLTDEEIKLAHRQGMQGLSLGPRILRTETAAITAISLLQQRWGDL
jgi:16S rRNA (uracil1498-N3)-methyltransferase